MQASLDKLLKDYKEAKRVPPAAQIGVPAKVINVSFSLMKVTCLPSLSISLFWTQKQNGLKFYSEVCKELTH